MFAEGLTALTVLCCAYHTERHQGYNEFNPGLIAESGPYIGGIYYNSLRKTTVLAGRTFEIADIGPVKTEFLAAVATGYRTPVIAMVRFHYHEVALHLAPTNKGGAIFALGWRQEW